MKRRLFALSLGGIAVLALTLTFASPALADGKLLIKNVSIDTPLAVEVRLGSSVQDSVFAANAVLKKGDTLNLDETNLQYFWRREVNPGSSDGKWTDWQRVDPRGGDQRVEI